MKKLKALNTDNLLFIDIETVRIEKELTENSQYYEAWKYKQRYNSEKNRIGDLLTMEELFNDKAALYAPFAKICCITIGKIKFNEKSEKEEIILLSIYGRDENVLLNNFNETLKKLYAKNKNLIFVGFNSNYFDIPFIVKRMLVNQIEYHDCLDKLGLKPWEINDIDLADLWKGTSFYQDSLVSIVSALGLESPKSDIDGSETSNVFWNEEDGVERIAKYCEKDVVATINIFKKFRFQQPIENVITNLK